ncbi:FAD-dependent thymidylate synthase [Patescibacteria group bacterium]
MVTKAHKRRFLMTMNLRELFYFVPLRGSPRGHFSYRRVAMACLEQARKVYPELTRFVPAKGYQSSAVIEKEFFARV